MRQEGQEVQVCAGGGREGAEIRWKSEKKIKYVVCKVQSPQKVMAGKKGLF